MMHCTVMMTAIPHLGGITYVFNFLDGFPGRCFFLSIYLLLAFKCISSDKSQYFLMPLTFLQECGDSAGFHWIPLEWDWNETGFHRNYYIPE